MITAEQKETLMKLATKEFGKIKLCGKCLNNPDLSFTELSNTVLFWFNTPDGSTHLTTIDKHTLKQVKIYQKACI